MRHHSKRGYVLITAGLCSIAVLGILGLAVDLGRLYIVKSEIQAFADSAALAAALELDGTATGVTRAANAVAANPNRWDLASTTFSGTQVDFATSSSGPWQANPLPAADYRFARVRASGAVPLYLLPAVGTPSSATMQAAAIAAQVLDASFSEGVFPFSPFSHNSAPPDFGYTPGVHYTLRWGAGFKPCVGDDDPAWIAQAQAGGSDERGYIEVTSADIIRQAIEQDYQSFTITVGSPVTMTGGNKQTQRDSLVNRVNQDTDTLSATYADYAASGTGNGRRLVAAAVNSGHPDNIVLGIGLFFLLTPSEYPNGGGKPFCAEYVGPYVQGSRHKGASDAGGYVVRLVQ
ncbi:MAG: pilus assembly protein TadG-related protein [Acidobacteriota bacterium]